MKKVTEHEQPRLQSLDCWRVKARRGSNTITRRKGS